MLMRLRPVEAKIALKHELIEIIAEDKDEKIILKLDWRSIEWSHNLYDIIDYDKERLH